MDFPNHYIFFVLMLKVPINDNFSVMTGCIPDFLGWTSAKQSIKRLAQAQVSLELATNDPKSNTIPLSSVVFLISLQQLSYLT